MGIPAFFRWLQKKYPNIVEHICDTNVDPSTHQKMWFDNLYLDMNNIIHPCTHPEDKPPPETEEQMFEAIFEYTEMVMEMVKPRKMVFLAIDGVAPRAKMNQQRTRRFRAVQESEEKSKQIEIVRTKLREKNIEPERSKTASFDSNVITPGTEFMTNLSVALQKWIQKKLSNPDKVWHKNLKVILSDASVPGEGEHKIMDYLRSQKANRGLHNPELRHCLYGADADLIMLGLATHEKHFTILREEFKPFQPKPCDLCHKYGHVLNDCEGTKSIEDDEKKPIVGGGSPEFILIKLHTLKQCLRMDMNNESYVDLDFERFIDDYIFLCFFVGNDFLPHLPCLDIRENAVDRLLRIYHDVNRSYWAPGTYLTDNGTVNLDRCQEILHELGRAEQQIFKRRKVNNERYEARLMQNKRIKWNEDHPNGEPFPPPDDDVPDWVRFGENGCKERYYNSKFGIQGCYRQLADVITVEYIRGLCWVLAYYYNGCPDWQWFYPFHYAPFAEDMRSILNVKLNFNPEAPPFKPLEQLMAVFPDRSANALPPTWRKLMSDSNSPIIDFYPTDFKIDMNGKKQAYLGVALLPFIEEDRLFRALESVYPNLSDQEKHRNSRGENKVFEYKTLAAIN